MNFMYFLIKTYRMDKYKNNAWYKSINTRIKKEKAKFTLKKSVITIYYHLHDIVLP